MHQKQTLPAVVYMQDCILLPVAVGDSEVVEDWARI